MTAKIKLNAASGGGSFSLQAPSSSSNNRVFTLPDIADATMATVNGITMVDQWRLSSNYAIPDSNVNDITANWERNDNTGFGGIGSAMTESSGIFSFPSTGIYFILLNVQYYNGGGASISSSLYIQTKTGSGGSYGYRAEVAQSGYTTNAYGNGAASTLFDVTDTTHDTLKVSVLATTAVTLNGSSTRNRTGITFLRLGDT